MDDEFAIYLDTPTGTDIIIKLLEIKNQLTDELLKLIIDDIISKELLLIQEGTNKAYNKIFKKENNIKEFKRSK